MTNASRFRTKERKESHWIEWLTGVVSAAFVVTLIGWIGWDAMAPQEQGPDLSARLISIEARSDGHQVRFEVRNVARATAAQVVVRGWLLEGDRIVEVAETTLAYVPMRSKASGGLIFKNDPRQLSLRIAAVGYSDP